MVFNFNWQTQSKGCAKDSETIATLYIRSKYGASLAEFAQKTMKERTLPKRADEYGERVHDSIL